MVENKEKKQHQGIKNLKPVKTKEEARERGRNGGLANGKSAKRKKSLRELTNLLLEMQPNAQMTAMIKQMFPSLDPEDITNGAAMTMSMLNKAIAKGDVKAATFVRDTSGQTPETVITGLGVEKVFITKAEEKATMDHIKSVIGELDEKTTNTKNRRPAKR